MKKKRERLSWDEFFMDSALLASMRSSCLYFQTGAVIVKDKRIIASGYNGAPPGIENCLTRGCRKDNLGVEFEDKGKGVCRGNHAEYNTLAQISREDLKGTSLYTLHFPCSVCAKGIVGNSISEVIYSFGYEEKDTLTEELFKESGVKLRYFNLDLKRLIKIMRNVYRQLR